MNFRYDHDGNQIEMEKFREVAAFFRHLLQNMKTFNIRANFINISDNRDEIWKNAKFLAYVILKTPQN